MPYKDRNKQLQAMKRIMHKRRLKAKYEKAKAFVEWYEKEVIKCQVKK